MKSFAIARYLRGLFALVWLALWVVFFVILTPVGEAQMQTQFLPALLRLLALGSLASVIAVGVLALGAWLGGRWYCSWLCPLGILQDLAARIGRGWGKRRLAYQEQPARRGLRYGVLIGVGVAALGGWMLPLATVDPFAFFGRIGNSLLRPAIVWVNNFCWNTLRFESLTPLEKHLETPAVIVFTAICALTVLGLAVGRGRVFCNTLCPTGTLLGLLSRRALWPLRIERAKCINCRKCVKVCKAGCIDTAAPAIDFERCVGCLDCGAVCPVDAVKIGREAPASEDAPTQPGRRDFLIGLGAAAGVGALGALTAGAGRKTTPQPMPVMPPGAQNFARFHAKCTACGLCIANCPGKTLKPAGLEYGWSGLGQPRLAFEIGKCEYECHRCSSICPNGALKPMSLAVKQRKRIAMVDYLKPLCIVVVDHQDCGACAEHCPTGALQMVPYEGTLTIPKVIPELCIGCGSCEYICPARPKKAIVVHGLAEQETAADPAEVLKKKGKSSGDIEEFPF